MTADLQESSRKNVVRRVTGLFGAGIVPIVVGLLLLGCSPEAEVAVATPSGTPSLSTPTLLSSTDTPTSQARIDRAIVSPPTRTPTPTITPSPTTIPTNTPAPTSTPAPTNTDGPPPEIEWTQEEEYALQWLCYGEVGGMRGVDVDACLSVISTVRTRYAYGGSYPDALSAILAPGQFNVDIYTDRAGPDANLNWAVEQYQFGARGSCNGYYYFNSIPGALAECTIRASNGLFLQFHNQPLR